MNDLKPYHCPFIVVVDSDEKQPYLFTGLKANADEGGGPIIVNKVKQSMKHLSTGPGDYSILGMVGDVCIERKSKEDLYGSVARRENFEGRLERMNKCKMAAVVVEAEISSVLNDPPYYSDLNPKSLSRTIDSWSIRYPHVHWWFMPDRQWAEAKTYRLLERCWKIFAQDYPGLTGDS